MTAALITWANIKAGKVTWAQLTQVSSASSEEILENLNSLADFGGQTGEADGSAGQLTLTQISTPGGTQYAARSSDTVWLTANYANKTQLYTLTQNGAGYVQANGPYLATGDSGWGDFFKVLGIVAIAVAAAYVLPAAAGASAATPLSTGVTTVDDVSSVVGDSSSVNLADNYSSGSLLTNGSVNAQDALLAQGNTPTLAGIDSPGFLGNGAYVNAQDALLANNETPALAGVNSPDAPAIGSAATTGVPDASAPQSVLGSAQSALGILKSGLGLAGALAGTSIPNSLTGQGKNATPETLGQLLGLSPSNATLAQQNLQAMMPFILGGVLLFFVMSESQG